jgi:ribosomal protein S4
MGKYIGPKSKIARKFGEAIYGADKVLEKRNYPPGQHGLARKRKKVSEYGTQLSEKQKAKYTYGLLEKQFSRTYEQAARMGGITGENLLKLPPGQRRLPLGYRPDACGCPPARFALPHLRERQRREHPLVLAACG